MANTLHEVSRRIIVINKHEEPLLLWHNSVLTVRTDKGVNCIEFTQNLQCLDKNIDFNESIIPTPTTSPATSYLSFNRFIKNGLTNLELSQLALDRCLWPYSSHIVQEMVSVAAYVWSPPNMCYNNKCVLAVLNNIGHVELFCPRRGWISGLDVSKLVNKIFNIESIVPKCFSDIKQAVKIVESSAICWAPKLNQDGTCYFVTAQKDDNILVWSIKSDNVLSDKLSANFIGSIQTDSVEIVSIIFIMKSENEFVLIYSNVSGEIIALNCNVNKNVEIVNKKILWADKDRMITNHFEYFMIDGKILLSCNKHRHFVTLLLDKDYNVLFRYVKNINDYKITVITKFASELYVGTVNCEIYKITFIVSNETFDVKLNMVQLKETYANYELYGISFSSNNTLCALALLNRKILVRKESMKIEIALLANNLNFDSEIETILNNPTRSLTHMWDYIELFRYKCMKMKNIPGLPFNELLCEAETDIYKMKVYLILLKIYTVMQQNLKLNKGLLPECSVEVIHNKIMLLHAQTYVDKLHNLYKQHQHFPTDFFAESFAGLIKYLKYNDKNHEANYNNDISLDVYKNYNYICQCCDDPIDGFTCPSNHLNTFCSLTFTPIESFDYLICSCCGTTARIELYADKPLCIFCDTYLDLCKLHE